MQKKSTCAKMAKKNNTNMSQLPQWSDRSIFQNDAIMSGRGGGGKDMALKTLRALHLLPNDHNLTWLSFKSISQISYSTTYRHIFL